MQGGLRGPRPFYSSLITQHARGRLEHVWKMELREKFIFGAGDFLKAMLHFLLTCIFHELLETPGSPSVWLWLDSQGMNNPKALAVPHSGSGWSLPKAPLQQQAVGEPSCSDRWALCHCWVLLPTIWRTIHCQALPSLSVGNLALNIMLK